MNNVINRCRPEEKHPGVGHATNGLFEGPNGKNCSLLYLRLQIEQIIIL